MAFNVNTNNVLAMINKLLVNEGDASSPKYTKRAKFMEITSFSKLYIQLDVIDTPEYREDSAIDPLRYKLYLCRGLVSYFEGNSGVAKQFFKRACEYPDHAMVEYYRDIVRSTGLRLSRRHKYYQDPASTNVGLLTRLARAVGEGLLTFLVLDYLLFAPPYFEGFCVKESGSDACVPWASLLPNQAQGILFIGIITLSLVPGFIEFLNYARTRTTTTSEV